MKIRILAFGIAREILGTQQLEVEMADQSQVSDLKSWLVGKYPDFQKLAGFRVAVNQEYAEDQFGLSEQDEIVLIPPVAGG